MKLDNKQINNKVTAQHKEDVDENKKVFDYSVSKELSNIDKVKKLHDILEESFVSNMDLVKVNEVKDDIVKRILKYDKGVERNILSIFGKYF